MKRRDLLRLLSLSTLAGATGCGGVSADPSPAAFSRQTTPPFGFAPDVEFTLTAAPDEVALLPGAPTRVWRFTGRLLKGPADTLETLPGSYLGPVIRLRRGQQVRVRFANQLGEDSIVHWHGLDVPDSADGHPRLAIGHGQEDVYDFEVTNRAGTYWYHPHPHMRTGAQVYQGLAGLLLVSDADEDALALPSGEAELLCVLQDRRFDARNQLIYQAGGRMGMGMENDERLPWGPRAGERPAAADAGGGRRMAPRAAAEWIERPHLQTGWSRDLPMTVIGGDGGLLERPLDQRVLTLAPGQRADVLLDLTDLGRRHRRAPRQPGLPRSRRGRRGGDDGQHRAGAERRAFAGDDIAPAGTHGSGVPGPRAPADVRRVVVRRRRREVPARAAALPTDAVDARWPDVLNGRGGGRRDGAGWLDARVGIREPAERHGHGDGPSDSPPRPPVPGARAHGGRTTNALREGIVDDGWRDTVLVLPGETVRVQVTFTKHAGLYLYHCHILEHEDMGMMRNFRVS